MLDYSVQEPSLLPLGWLLVWAIYVIAFEVLAAVLVAKLAERKGKVYLPWFVYGLFFWPIALIQLLVLESEAGTARDRGVRHCPSCTMEISRKAVRCRYCTSEVVPEAELRKQGFGKK